MKKLISLIAVLTLSLPIVSQAATIKEITKVKADFQYKDYENAYAINEVCKEGKTAKSVMSLALSDKGAAKDVLAAFDLLNQTTSGKTYEDARKAFLVSAKNLSAKEFIAVAETAKKNVVKCVNDNKIPFFNALSGDDEFMFVVSGMKSHKYLSKNDGEIAKKAGIEPEMLYAVIMTEQARGAVTQRAHVKKFLKSVPFLFSFTSGSIGIGGIKDFTAWKIENDARSYGYGKIFAHSDVCGEAGCASTQEKTDKQFDETASRLSDKRWEVVYPAYLIRNIVERWSKAGFDISSNHAVIATLYNLGNPSDKEPHANPKIGGAEIEMPFGTVSFGELANAFYWYFKAEQPFAKK